jgi:NAD(P)-dependent dehydrogenase (short-subunit alcohol dehydrogenase family)
MVQNTPLGRLGTPKDIADLVTYLASDNSGWITGSLSMQPEVGASPAGGDQK